MLSTTTQLSILAAYSCANAKDVVVNMDKTFNPEFATLNNHEFIYS